MTALPFNAHTVARINREQETQRRREHECAVREAVRADAIVAAIRRAGVNATVECEVVRVELPGGYTLQFEPRAAVFSRPLTRAEYQNITGAKDEPAVASPPLTSLEVLPCTR